MTRTMTRTIMTTTSTAIWNMIWKVIDGDGGFCLSAIYMAISMSHEHT